MFLLDIFLAVIRWLSFKGRRNDSTCRINKLYTKSSSISVLISHSFILFRLLLVFLTGNFLNLNLKGLARVCPNLLSELQQNTSARYKLILLSVTSDVT